MINLKALAILEKNLPAGSTIRVERFRSMWPEAEFAALTSEEQARAMRWPPAPASSYEICLGHGLDETGVPVAVFLKDLRVWGPSSPPLTKGELEKHKPKPCSIGAAS